MSRTPITIYVDFETATKIRAMARTLGVSQSQWVGKCVASAVGPSSHRQRPILMGWDYLRAVADHWLEQQPDAIYDQVVELMNARSREFDARSASLLAR